MSEQSSGQALPMQKVVQTSEIDLSKAARPWKSRLPQGSSTSAPSQSSQKPAAAQQAPQSKS